MLSGRLRNETQEQPAAEGSGDVARLSSAKPQLKVNSFACDKTFKIHVHMV